LLAWTTKVTFMTHLMLKSEEAYNNMLVTFQMHFDHVLVLVVQVHESAGLFRIMAYTTTH